MNPDVLRDVPLGGDAERPPSTSAVPDEDYGETWEDAKRRIAASERASGSSEPADSVLPSDPLVCGRELVSNPCSASRSAHEAGEGQSHTGRVYTAMICLACEPRKVTLETSYNEPREFQCPRCQRRWLYRPCYWRFADWNEHVEYLHSQPKGYALRHPVETVRRFFR